ncbi:MAG TPA: transketolase C-terminal domain-containing protein [Spirochaetia bacterium]|nr:transketolase C-terminal domain-containing protein [Spirochaetales bacterium]HRW24173.1 transketolase C-terminal domain-containing protein [Spirochaetia bacterium]
MSGLTFTMLDTAKMSTAEIYGQALCGLGEEHPEIVGLSADLAKSTKIGAFGEKFPDRFFNVGIAEQNMFGMAAGLAKAGLVPYVSTFAIFTAMRGLDQVHTDICYQNLDVKMIATHAGLSFGQAGTTHHCTEDIAIMRSMANLTVVVPADGVETANAVRAAYERKGPVYIRINRGFDQVVYDGPDYGFEIGKAVTMRDGTDLTVIACGSTVWRAVEAAAMLEKSDGLKVRVLNMHTIKPIDAEAIERAVRETRRIITVEDHSVVGGLGGAVAEVAAGTGKSFSFKRLGVPDCFSIIGLHEDLLAHYGIDENGIAAAVREMMGKDFEADDDWEDEV